TSGLRPPEMHPFLGLPLGARGSQLRAERGIGFGLRIPAGRDGSIPNSWRLTSPYKGLGAPPETARILAGRPGGSDGGGWSKMSDEPFARCPGVLLGPREMSDLSPQSGPKRTLIGSLSPIAIL